MARRIAVVGGGPAALATAYELSAPALNGEFEIDVYTLGWRLGGKCASSRNLAKRGRNEEHGLHILGGFYHNVFQQLEPLYKEWNAIPGQITIPWAKALKPHDSFTLLQPKGANWNAARVRLPRNGLKPGHNPDPLTMKTIMARILDWIGASLFNLSGRGSTTDWINLVGDEAAGVAPSAAAIAEAKLNLDQMLSPMALSMMAADFQRLALEARELVTEGSPQHTEVMTRLSELQALLQSGRFKSGVRNLDLFGALEFFTVLGLGIARDNLLTRGFDAINNEEASDWLARHGASPNAIACPLFQAGYHYAFAYTDGIEKGKGIAAGAGIRGILKMVFTYHGAVFFHMNGGMGEIFVTPYYDVLKKRGVRFHFFHRLEDIELDQAGTVSKLQFAIQAKCEAGSASYDPVVDYQCADGSKRRVWPEGPLTSQLTAESKTAISKKDLEAWFDGKGLAEPRTLERGKDFEIVVLATNVSTLRYTARRLADKLPRWKTMLEKAADTPTIAAQIWRSDHTVDYRGWIQDKLFTAYELPHSTWAEMNFQLAYEQPDAAGKKPNSVSYLCGPVPRPPNPADPNLPAAEARRAFDLTRKWLADHAGRAFPGIIHNGKYDPAKEFEEIFARINSDPVSLYVTTPPGSVDARLRPKGSGVPGLFLAGDWTRNNFDLGAVEVAVQSARLCAKEISGYPEHVYGDSDFE